MDVEGEEYLSPKIFLYASIEHAVIGCRARVGYMAEQLMNGPEVKCC